MVKYERQGTAEGASLDGEHIQEQEVAPCSIHAATVSSSTTAFSWTKARTPEKRRPGSEPWDRGTRPAPSEPIEVWMGKGRGRSRFRRRQRMLPQGRNGKSRKVCAENQRCGDASGLAWSLITVRTWVSSALNLPCAKQPRSGERWGKHLEG